MILMQMHDTKMGVLKYLKRADMSKRVGRAHSNRGRAHRVRIGGTAGEVEGLGVVASGIVFERKGS